MLPQGTHAHLPALASAINLLLADDQTPKQLRRLLLKFTRKLRKQLPPAALREVEAAEAEAVIQATDYLRYDRRSCG